MTTATATATATSRFRLLRGRHVQKNQDGVPTLYDAKDPTKNIVESDKDLELMFGPEKFQSLDRMGGSSENTSALQRRIEELEAENSKLRGTPTEDDYDLPQMTNKELRKYAEEMEIDLGTANSKEELINTIRSALDAR